MTDKIYCSLLLFGLINVFASSSSDSSPLSTVNCTCDDDMKKIKCVGLETDNNTVISTVNNILMSPNCSSISEVHIESPNLQTESETWFPNATIEKLTIINSNLTDIPELALSNLNGLLNLTLTNNSFVNIPGKSLRHLRTLKYLILSHNKIQHIFSRDMKNLSTLKYLSLAHNFITSIEDGSFSSLSNLTALILDSNMLSSVQKPMFTGLKNLETLDLSANNLFNLLENVFKDLVSLKFVIANNNNFTSLKNIEIVTPSLETLYLKNSSINGPLAPRMLGGIPSLKKLILSFNPIGSILAFAFSELWELTALQLDSCKLVTLNENAFHNLSRLTILDLSNNMLKEFTCMHTLYLESLEEINLMNNQLKTIEAGAFYYSSSLFHIDLKGNTLMCNCQLASFANLTKATLDSDEVDCDNGKTLDEVNFAGMNCANNADICTKDKELKSWQNVTSTISEPSFTIQFGDINQYPGTIEVEYNITKNGNFPLTNFRCEIAFSSLIQIYYETLDVCDIGSNDLQFVTVDAEEMGKYNVCVSIIYNEKTYYVECLITEYNLTVPTDDTINEDHQTSSSTSTFHNTSTATVHTTALTTTIENILSLSTSISKSSTINNIFKTTIHATTSVITVEDISSVTTSAPKTTTVEDISSVTTSAPKTTTTVEDISSITTSASKTTTVEDISSVTTSAPKTTTVEDISSITTSAPKTTTVEDISSITTSAPKTTTADNTSIVTSVPETSTVIPTTYAKATNLAGTTTVSVSSTYFPTTKTEAFTTTSFPTTAAFSIDVTQPSQKSPFVKSFSISRDARSRLWFSWNVTLEHPITTCTLEFSLILHSQSQNNWHTECSNGSYLLGDLNSAHLYQICVEMYWQEKLIETNCIEISPSSVLPVAASSKGSGASEKLSAAAFIALVIVAVIILILIIIVLIKLVYLRRNKTNIYDVAKEEEDNQNQITKRSSNLYSVSSVEDDQV